jgi:hypothetical protein
VYATIITDTQGESIARELRKQNNRNERTEKKILKGVL